MATWSIKRVQLPLKFTWNIARGKCSERENLYISYQDGDFIGTGEVAFMTNEGKTITEIENRFQQFSEEVAKNINGLEDMMAILEDSDLDDFTQLRFGIESAYVHFLAQLLNGNVQSVLGIETVTKRQTCFSLPILEKDQYGDFIKEHQLERFSALKIKVNKESGLGALKEVRDKYQGDLWVDANESFSDVQDCLHFLKEAKAFHVKIMEQPFKRNDYQSFMNLKDVNQTGILIFADESLTYGAITDNFSQYFDGVNIKLMKAGGYFSALRQIREAKKLGLKVLLGCMLESSLGIYSAMNICSGADYIDLDSTLFLTEDPLNLVYEESGLIQISSNQ